MWIEEKLEINKGRTLKIKITKSLEKVKSKFQEIEVVNSDAFGKILLIDGIIMVTESDEFCYHEMIAHVPLCVHPKAQKVLVIGGGDGGTVREILKHDNIKEVEVCEIDENKVKICCEDGDKFIKSQKNKYDLIIVDSSDPIGPAEVLFRREFYEAMYQALKDDGIVVTQAESFFYHSKIIKSLFSFIRDIYPISEYYYTLVPTYPSGVIGFTFCSKKYHPINNFNETEALKLNDLKYYDRGIHKSALNERATGWFFRFGVRRFIGSKRS
ncbi:polyamine aminopropyltransferase [Candidatus Atribacteria bacterium HGW-Atribacteria-1]|nr:MAG: polyamine aminopropyltransferase [Candidatus Atribacteria bacterium HGW-Atribacteria-1]